MRKIVLSVFTILLLCFQVVAQNQRVSGTVTDHEGSPMIGVTVILKGTNVAAVTNIDGAYSINVPSNAILEFSSLGMVTQEILVSGRTLINVRLETDTQMIDDIVVTSLLPVKPKDLTGSISAMTSQDLSKRNITTVTKALEGQVAGVSILSSTGQPGIDANVYIRGLGSISASATALFIVDGVPYSSGLSTINPNDIESMVVSKDAAANALYGSRAANGIVFVTTKRGKAGKAKINFEAKVGVTSIGIPETPTIQDAGLYYEILWEQIYNYATDKLGRDDASARALAQGNYHGFGGYYNNFWVPEGESYIDIATGKMNPNAKLLYQDNYDDHIFNKSIRQEYNLSVSGGNDRSDYFMSVGYLSDPSYVIQSKLDRYSFRAQLNSKVTNWLTVGTNFSYTHRLQNYPSGFSGGEANTSNMFLWTKWQTPVVPYYARDLEGNIKLDENGKKVYETGLGSTDSPWGSGASDVFNSMNYGHPVGTFEKDIQKYMHDNLFAKAYADVNFLKDFTLHVNATLDNRYYNQTVMQNKEYGYASQQHIKGYIGKAFGRAFGFNSQQLLKWDKTFDNKHNVLVQVGHEFNYTSDSGMSASKNYLYLFNVPELSNAIKPSGSGSSSSTTRSAMEGYFASAYYTYDNKYNVTASFRRDGSSVFKYNLYGNFWTVGASWTISREDFMKNAKFVNNLRLRTNYGITGNSNISGFPYTDMWSIGSAGAASDPQYTLTQGALGNPNLMWEENAQFSLGIDALLFDRISLTLDYYTRKTKNMAWSRPTPPSSGITSRMENVGVLGNDGFEFDLGVNIISTKDINWRVSVNGAFNKNYLAELPSVYENPYITGAYKRGTDKPYYNLYLYKFAGLDEKGYSTFWREDPETGEMSKVSTLGEATRFELGDSLPDWTGGFGTTFRWKGLDLTVQFAYQIGGRKVDFQSLNLSDMTRPGFTFGEYQANNYWTPERTDTDVPKPVYGHSEQMMSSLLDYWWRDASYISLKTVNIGYTLPTRWTNKASIASARIFVNADNLWFKSSFEGFDPRGGMTSQSFMNYPQSKNISVGINLTF